MVKTPTPAAGRHRRAPELESSTPVAAEGGKGPQPSAGRNGRTNTGLS